MATKGKRNIYVGPADHGHAGKPLNIEGKAIAATLPGTLVTTGSSGIAISADAATVFGTLPLFADKDQQRTRSVDVSWAIDENMVAIQARSGEFFNVLVATAQTLVVGDPLVSNGAGLLTKGTGANTQHVVCNSDEALTTSGTELVLVRIV